MKPLWIVTVRAEVDIPVVAANMTDAEMVANDLLSNGDLEDNLDFDAFAYNEPLTNLKALPFAKDDLVWNTDKDYTVEQYITAYNQEQKEIQKKKELEERQGKLF